MKSKSLHRDRRLSRRDPRVLRVEDEAVSPYPRRQAGRGAYYTRKGPWSYEEHRRIFDSYSGRKVEYADLEFSGCRDCLRHLKVEWQMDREPTTMEKSFGDFAPKIVKLTDQVLFADGLA
jgi:hypothetical protein